MSFSVPTCGSFLVSYAGNPQDVSAVPVQVLVRIVPTGRVKRKVEVLTVSFPGGNEPRGVAALDALPRLFNVQNNRRGRRFRRVQQETPAGFLENFHRLQNILFAFFTKASEVPELAFLGNSLHVSHGSGLDISP